MKTRTNILTVAIAVGLLIAASAYCQEDKGAPVLPALKESKTYQTAIGLRAGETSGITLKQFVNDNSAFEGILGIWRNGMSATALFEKYTPAFNVAGLHWYYGGGGHAAFEASYVYIEGRRFDRAGGLGLGVDAILGLEYKIAPIPFAISLDLKPYMEINTDGRIYLGPDPGLGIKFAF